MTTAAEVVACIRGLAHGVLLVEGARDRGIRPTDHDVDAQAADRLAEALDAWKAVPAAPKPNADRALLRDLVLGPHVAFARSDLHSTQDQTGSGTVACKLWNTLNGIVHKLEAAAEELDDRS